MRQCQIQCNFWGIDDLCKLCKEYLIALTYFILDKILNFDVFLLMYFYRHSLQSYLISKTVLFFGPPCIQSVNSVVKCTV